MQDLVKQFPINYRQTFLTEKHEPLTAPCQKRGGRGYRNFSAINNH